MNKKDDHQTNLVIHRIPLGNQHPVDATPVTRPRRRREISKSAIKLCELIDGLVADQRLSNKYYFIGVVYRYKL
jgi:hypothetical protein